MLDFLICYEHVNREVENDALIKHELVKRGYSCEIMPFNGPGFFRHVMSQKAKVVVAPWLRYDDNVFHYLCLTKRPYRIVNLQWEQIYCENDLKSGMCTVDGESTKALHLCWGENAAWRLSSSGVRKDSLFVTGAIQVDYGREVFRKYFYDRGILAKEFGLSNEKRWVLFISSFAYVAYGDDAINKLSEQFDFSCCCYTLEEQVALHRASQGAVLDWIDALLARENCEFIYRPHPSENASERLLQFAEQHPSFHIISKYSVKQWAKVCDKINLWISTSNAEVAAMGRDFNIVRPIPIPPSLEVESMRGESFVTDVDTFIRLNTTYEEAEKHAAECLGRMSRFYAYDPLHPAYCKVADVLETVIQTSLPTAYHFTWNQRMRFGRDEIKKMIVSFIAETQLAFPNRKIIDRIPLKKHIKQNLHKAIEKYQDGKQVEARMLAYMDTMDNGKSDGLLQTV